MLSNAYQNDENNREASRADARDPVSLQREQPVNNMRQFCRKKPDEALLWYDSERLNTQALNGSVFSRISELNYNGVILYLHNFESLLPMLPNRFLKVIHIDSLAELTTLLQKNNLLDDISVENKLVIISNNLEVLAEAQAKNLPCGLRMNIVNANDLHQSIAQGKSYNYLILSFADPTNIPLELVIASLEFTDTFLIKEIKDPVNIDDAIVVAGVMEVGAEGVIFSPIQHEILDRFIARTAEINRTALNIQSGRVILTKPIGMGYRGCIDLATLFTPEEGMLVGSTSQGGILCCPEVFYLPYMELRPFRVNAGGIHSYVYNVNDKTDYMSELRVGDSLMIVGVDGKVKQAPLGRMKIEMRPLRLIEVEFDSGEKVNVILQDDWHVRIFSEEGKPSNITSLKVGDKVLGYVTEPGRHVGIKIKENIIEK